MSDQAETKSTSKGNPAWRKGGPSPNPSGKRKDSKDSGRDVAVGPAEAIAMLASLRGRATKDGWENVITGLGQAGYDKTIGGTFAIDVIDDITAFALWQGDDIGCKIVETWPAEMLRRPFQVRVGSEKVSSVEPIAPEGGEQDLSEQADKPVDKSQPRKDWRSYLRALVRGDAVEKGNKKVQDQVKADFKRLKLIPALKRALEYREAYGGSGILLGVSDNAGGLDKPLGNKIRSINFLTVFERRELTPLYYYNDPSKPRYREVSHYQLNAISTAGPSADQNAATVPVGQIIHESRLMLFGAEPISPGLNLTTNPGWQLSKFTRVWRVLRGFQSAWASTDNLLADFAIAIWKLKDLALLVSSNNGQGAADLKARMQLMSLAQSILRATVVDSEEEYERKTTTLTGLPEILSLYMPRVAAAADIPVTRLFGTSPGGLNATGESDIEFFDDRIEARQENELTPQLEKLIKIEMQVIGYTADDWSIYYPPLRQETDAEKATARKTQADTDAVYIDRGVLTPEEVTLHRFGGDEYSFETPLDLDARAIAARQEERELKEAEEAEAKMAQLEAGAEAKMAQLEAKKDAHRRGDDWDEDKHPRDERGRFGAGGGGESQPHVERARALPKPDTKGVKKERHAALHAELEEATNTAAHQFASAMDRGSQEKELATVEQIHRERSESITRDFENADRLLASGALRAVTAEDLPNAKKMTALVKREQQGSSTHAQRIQESLVEVDRLTTKYTRALSELEDALDTDDTEVSRDRAFKAEQKARLATYNAPEYGAVDELEEDGLGEFRAKSLDELGDDDDTSGVDDVDPDTITKDYLAVKFSVVDEHRENLKQALTDLQQRQQEAHDDLKDVTKQISKLEDDVETHDERGEIEDEVAQRLVDPKIVKAYEKAYDESETGDTDDHPAGIAYREAVDAAKVLLHEHHTPISDRKTPDVDQLKATIKNTASFLKRLEPKKPRAKKAKAAE